MSEEFKDNKREIDADQVIRQYEETAYTEEPEEAQTEIPWYEQATQDTTVPADAVLTGGDIDAAWDQASVGEETVGGSTPTPDQDIVDEIGRAVGVNYEDSEPLDPEAKIERRDTHRWELHPASSEDFAERTHPTDMRSATSEEQPPLADTEQIKRNKKAA
ncbi:MAG: hypothetical protein K0S79_1026 [Nitrospira sp.]|jgi:hypothetical protein|nr:hypothetical protein [Nitrospira sp.]